MCAPMHRSQARITPSQAMNKMQKKPMVSDQHDGKQHIHKAQQSQASAIAISGQDSLTHIILLPTWQQARHDRSWTRHP